MLRFTHGCYSATCAVDGLTRCTGTEITLGSRSYSGSSLVHREAPARKSANSPKEPGAVGVPHATPHVGCDVRQPAEFDACLGRSLLGAPDLLEASG